MALSRIRHSGASYFLAISAWTLGTLLFLGFGDKRPGILGVLGSTGTFIATVTIIPSCQKAATLLREVSPTGNVPFLMKDVVLLAVSFYLLKQDVVRVAQHDLAARRSKTGGLIHSGQE